MGGVGIIPTLTIIVFKVKSCNGEGKNLVRVICNYFLYIHFDNISSAVIFVAVVVVVFLFNKCPVRID